MGVFFIVTWCAPRTTSLDTTRIFLLGILIFKGLTARRLYISFGFKSLRPLLLLHIHISPSTSSGQRNCASWASQPQKSVTLMLYLATWCARATSLDTTHPSTIFYRMFRN